jgi:hypothetical protein
MTARSRFVLGVFASLAIFSFSSVAVAADSGAAAVGAIGNTANAQLAAGGYDFRLEYAEFLTDASSSNVGQTVFFNNRGNKQLAAHYVPGDPRRGGGTNITYTIDQTEGSVDGLTQAQTNAAIGRAMTTWDNVNCSTIPIDAVGNPGTDIGFVEFLNGLGGSPFIFADLTHAGWLPPGILAPNVIAVTFTFVWIDGLGNPTDIDNNGKADVAIREILYNDAFTWQINANIDVETVALHEAGHGLSQDHFGAAFVNASNGKVHFAPRAVMNAAYSGVQQTINQTDNGGHCSIWAQWPNN